MALAAKLTIVVGLVMLAFTGYQAMICEYMMTISHGSILILTAYMFLVCFSLFLADREDLRLAQKEFEGLPAKLLIQLLGSSFVCLLGSLKASGQFKPIALADIIRWAVILPVVLFLNVLPLHPCYRKICVSVPSFPVACLNNLPQFASVVCRPTVFRPQRLDFATFNHRGSVFSSLPYIKELPKVPSIS